MKRPPEDKYFSDCIRTAAFWTCENCGKYFPEGSRQAFHCAHTVSRSRRSVRWLPLNASALCAKCHLKTFSENPLEFSKWIEEKIGKELHEKLIRWGNTPIKFTKKDKTEIAQHYRDELKFLQQQRMQGVTGKLPIQCCPLIEERLV